MVFLNIYLDNLYLYNDFNMNFTYPKKLNYSTVDNEHLKDFPNFKYRKVNIIMGANSSGKTSLGKVMMNMQNFLRKKNLEYIPFDKVNDKRKNSHIKIDFVVADVLYRYDVIFTHNSIKSEAMYLTHLKKTDSYETACKRLVLDSKTEEGKGLEGLVISWYNFNFGWYYSFAMLTDGGETSGKIELKVLNKILKGFDSTIRDIKKIPSSENSYNIIFDNGENILLQNGKIIDVDRISSGTYESIRLATIVSEMLNMERICFIDENIVHSHTELEKGILNLMIAVLHEDSQLFFTTHNSDILDMNLPMHAIQFLTNKEGVIEVCDVSKTFKKRDRNLRNYVENDVFNTQPDTEFLLELLDER